MFDIFDISVFSTRSLSRFLYQNRSLLCRGKRCLLLSALCLLTACGGGTHETSPQPQPPQTVPPTTVATPTLTPASGTNFASTLSVSIADATSGAIIYYTTDGSTPSTSSQVYSAPFTIRATTRVNAIASEAGDTQARLPQPPTPMYQSQPQASSPTISTSLG
jgi:hypothetical protein